MLTTVPVESNTGPVLLWSDSFRKRLSAPHAFPVYDCGFGWLEAGVSAFMVAARRVGRGDRRMIDADASLLRSRCPVSNGVSEIG